MSIDTLPVKRKKDENDPDTGIGAVEEKAHQLPPPPRLMLIDARATDFDANDDRVFDQLGWSSIDFQHPLIQLLIHRQVLYMYLSAPPSSASDSLWSHLIRTSQTLLAACRERVRQFKLHPQVHRNAHEAYIDSVERLQPELRSKQTESEGPCAFRIPAQSNPVKLVLSQDERRETDTVDELPFVFQGNSTDGFSIGMDEQATLEPVSMQIPDADMCYDVADNE